MWEILSLGKWPYAGIANDDIGEYIRSGGRLCMPELCPLIVYVYIEINIQYTRCSYKQIMLECWNANETERPTFNDICVQWPIIIENVNKNTVYQIIMQS
jgi:hypothetical protein